MSQEKIPREDELALEQVRRVCVSVETHTHTPTHTHVHTATHTHTHLLRHRLVTLHLTRDVCLL